MGTQATVLGASGYTGGELLRLAASHPGLEVVAAAGGSRAGEPLAVAHPHLRGGAVAELVTVEEAIETPADVCFSCLPSGQLGAHLDSVKAGLIVDLADDFRADGAWVYGLTEYARESLVDATAVANPGCYPTATLLCLLPFARAKFIEPPIVVDALSGVSGAGRQAEDHLLYGSIAESVGAYGSVRHRHVPEMERTLSALGGFDASVSFTPHLVPQARGLLVTARARVRSGLSDGDVLGVLQQTYDRESFVHVLEEWPSTKPVAGTNRADVSARIDDRNGWLIASAAIDNLGKGAAGQALQNANVALGLEETAGLSTVGMWP